MRPDPMQVAPALPPPRPTAPIKHHVLLINPFYPKEPCASFGKHVLTPSLGLPSLAAVTPPPWRVEFWDENLLQGPPPMERVPQVVGITVHLTFAQRAYELARWCRAHGCVVVMGGQHAISCPDEVAQHCDAVAVGNGVPLWPRILADIEADRLQPRYQAPFTDYAAEPWPDRSILPRWGFLTPASLIATRGCHNRCAFCVLSTGTERISYQVRDPHDVAREFASTGAPYGVFIDNNLGARRDYLRSLCNALEPLGRIWSAAVSLDVTDDPSVVAEMAASGCTGVFVGFESLEDENLRSAGKRTPRSCDYARRVEIFHRHGIQVNGSFVFGFDGDTPDVFGKTAEWIESVRLESATFHILTPYPNTPLFRRFDEEGRILHRNWSLYDTAHAVFQPRHMSPGELEEGYRWIYQRIFSGASIWRRRPHEASAVLPYLAMAWLYKRANPLWKLLISLRLTRSVWAPLVHLTRLRHLHSRAQARRSSSRFTPALPVPPGV